MKNLIASYQRDIIILHGISIHADRAKITCIIGPNGSGKSTLLKTIYGYLEAKQGTIIFDGIDITHSKAYTKPGMGLGYIPQRRTIFPYMTVEENLQLGGWTFRKDKKRVKESINKIFERLPVLETKKKVRASTLSGGEQRMLELGRVLITKPKMILMDEPTAGLAPKIAKGIYQELQKLSKETIAILLVDQNVRKAISLADYVYLLKVGQVHREGPREEIERRSASIISDWLI